MSALVYTTMPSPIGSLLVVADSGAIIRVAFESEGFEAILAHYVGAQQDDTSALLTAARTQLDEYFAGVRKDFELPLAPSSGSDFRQRVLSEIAALAYGTTVTYRELATRSGNPDAVRAAGTACGSNPLPLVVPCHRVVRSDGSIGSYLGGETAKKWLLDHENGK